MKERPSLFLLAIFVLLFSCGSVCAEDQKLPQLVDLGADRCVPCRMMKPVLDELSKEYEGRLDVIFIDVWKNKDAGVIYGIRVIPTQIFFSPEGKELFRHEGYFSKADILKKWEELGFPLTPGQKPAKEP